MCAVLVVPIYTRYAIHIGSPYNVGRAGTLGVRRTIVIEKMPLPDPNVPAQPPLKQHQQVLNDTCCMLFQITSRTNHIKQNFTQHQWKQAALAYVGCHKQAIHRHV
jgi:hypothetical protein